jgi:hypothetical protein
MGAYDNPKLFNAYDATAGSRAFVRTFTKGFEEGYDKFGTQKIAERKEYEKGIFEKGEELKKQLDVAVENGSQTRAQVQDALKSFYDEALAVDPVTKKGIGGLFATPKEKRLGDIDLQEAQSNFTDAVTPINTMFNYSFSGENDILETEDRGHEFYKEKRILYEAIRDGKAKTNFGYTDGKFNSSVTVEINGEMKTFTPDKIQAIFTASGPEQRAAIDKRHDEFTDGVYSEMEANVANAVERAKTYGYRTYKDGENEARRIIQRRLGIADPDPNKLPSKKSLAFINDEYNNHSDIDANRRLQILREQPELQSLTDAQLELIAEEPLMIGEKFFERFGDNAAELFEASIKGKTRIVEEAALQDIRDQGILDKGYAPPAPPPPRSSGTDTSGDDAYLKQKVRTETAGVVNTVIDSTAFKNAAKPYMMATKGGIPPKELQNDKPIFTSSAGVSSLGLVVEQSLDENQKREIKEFGDSFLNSEFTFRGAKENASGVEIGADGSVVLTFDGKTVEEDILDDKNEPTGKKRTKILKDQTLSFNIYEPESMRRYFDAISTESGGSGTYSRKAYSQGYDQQMLAEYTTNEGLVRLNQPGMDKWISFIDTKGGRDTLFEFVIVNEKNLSDEFQDYLDINRDAIDEYMEQKARK